MNDIDTIYAPNYMGAGWERYEYVPETGLYHWHGEESCGGYTAEELYSRWELEEED